METDYQKQAADFAKKHGITLTINGQEYKRHWDDDKQSRWVFNCTLKRKGKQYTFDFGQSTAAGDEKPTMYDVLTCIEKYDHPTFEDFCGDYGYDTDSRKAERTFKAVQKEYKAVERLFGDIMDELQEIQ